MATKIQRNKSKPFALVAIIVGVFILSFFVLKKSLFAPSCANSLSCKESLSFNVDNDAIGTFYGQKVTPPKIDITQKVNPKKILGEANITGEKHIYVDLATQTLTAFQGDTLFMQAFISSGKWGKTPTGDFTIWEKVQSTKMSGGSGADYYYLPNVPFVMFFSNDKVAAGRGFSLHGTYWHNNFGHPMSHGCVNMRTVDAEKLYYWANPDAGNKRIILSSEGNLGTKITIYGKAP